IPEEQWIALYDEVLAEWSRMGRVLDVLTSNVPAMENLVRRARAYDQPLKDKPQPEGRGTPGKDAAGSAASENDPENGLEILLVTDSLVDRRLLEKKLGAAGHKIITAANGREALRLALQTNPQLILTDWMLPEMDGLDLCRTLRRSEQMGNCHILIMTSNSSQQELEEGFEAGIDDYLIKPLNHRILAAKVRSAARVIQLQVLGDRDRKAIQRHLKTMALQKRELQKMYEQVERLAMEDQLTGLPNRRAGLDRLEQVWAEASRTRNPMLVMVMDIDKFKRVNDTYGHDAGDVVLRSTAGVMRNTLREYDIVCRFGGEEFLVICPGADIQIAMALGDRIRAAVENNHISTPEFEGNVTISIGVSVRGDEHANPQEMIKEADEALYAAKNAGRNKVCIA
ncbi:diguanylate cyclase, partial [bacterium]|nr:diguanylate cyclase [bacterium]